MLLLAGCAPAALRVDRHAGDYGFARSVVETPLFAHVVYRNAAERGDGALHVYIEGDGMPWIARRHVAADPTHATTLMLELMALDPAPSVYLGRPCYLGFARRAPCTPRDWTSDRYSPRIVESMRLALLQVAGDKRPLLLFGHSGGGALAMLMAENLPNVRVVVTLAGVLNVRGWTDYHRYTPLTGSLDPARRPPLPPGLHQLHLAGGRDRNVPARLVEQYSRRQPQAEYRFFARFDHDCCWRGLWPDLLAEFDAGF